MFLRKNTYDEATQNLTIPADRYEVFLHLKDYYTGLFMDDPSLDKLRADYAIPKKSIKNTDRMDILATFFFWPS